MKKTLQNIKSGKYILNMKDLRGNSKSGCYGEYYPFKTVDGTLGVKVLFEHGGGYDKSIADLKHNRDTYGAAKYEARILRRAASTGLSPRCHGVIALKDGDGYRAGILMDHVQGMTLGEYATKIATDLQEQLDRAGVVWSDNSNNNVIVQVEGNLIKKIYAIDFTKGYASLKRRHKKR